MIKNSKKPQTNVRKKKLGGDLKTSNVMADNKKAKSFVKGINKSGIEKKQRGYAKRFSGNPRFSIILFALTRLI